MINTVRRLRHSKQSGGCQFYPLLFASNWVCWLHHLNILSMPWFHTLHLPIPLYSKEMMKSISNYRWFWSWKVIIFCPVTIVHFHDLYHSLFVCWSMHRHHLMACIVPVSTLNSVAVVSYPDTVICLTSSSPVVSGWGNNPILFRYIDGYLATGFNKVSI